MQSSVLAGKKLIIVVLAQKAQGAFCDCLLRNNSRFEFCMGYPIGRTHGSVLANLNQQCWPFAFGQSLRIVLCYLFDNSCSVPAASLQSHSLNALVVFL